MSACEKCWEDAYFRMLCTGKSQVECYYELLQERAEYPCSDYEQMGQFKNASELFSLKVFR